MAFSAPLVIRILFLNKQPCDLNTATLKQLHRISTINTSVVFIFCVGTITVYVLCFQGPVFLRVQGYPCNRQESRALSFSEEKAHWQIPMNEVNIICDVTTKDGIYTHAKKHYQHCHTTHSQVSGLFREY